MPEALARPIHVPQATAMVVGTIIGASIFVQPSEISRFVPHIAGTLAVWMLAGLLTFCGALVCAELASALPRTGGVYVFLAESLSPLLGFLWGWAMFWTTHSGIIAAIAVVFARYVAYFVPLNEGEIQAVAIAAVVTLSAINYVGVSYGTAVQTAFTVVKVAAIVAILLLVAIFGDAAEQTAGAGGLMAGASIAGASIAGVRELVLALSAGLFAFGGWHMVTYAAGETREASRTIPRALLIGTVIVTLCYLALNAAYLVVLPLDRVQQSMHVAADAAEAVGGPLGARAVAMLVVISAFGAASGIVLAGPRVYYAMACDGLWFRWMAAIHPRFQTPHIAIVAQAIWVSILILTATYRDLFTRVIYTEWIFFALMAVGLMRLRRRAGYTPRYRIWGYAVVPLLFIAASSLVVVTQVIANPADSASGLLLVATGVPVYWWWTRGATRQRGLSDARD
jgi:APA family basic amino acid/polyamine antiporter